MNLRIPKELIVVLGTKPNVKLWKNLGILLNPGGPRKVKSCSDNFSNVCRIFISFYLLGQV